MNNYSRSSLLFFLTLFICSNLISQENRNKEIIIYKTETDVLYQEKNLAESDKYINERCRLDIYYPENQKGFGTVVWFHGGGLREGNKDIPEEIKNKGLAIVAANYRMFPRIKAPVYIEDAAASVAWVFNNIADYGGDANLIFISGHSAGGYLASMIGLDKSWLAKYNVDADNIAGLIPFSGHTITHFTVREERNIPGTKPIIDNLAPLYHVRNDAPPLILITGDRNLEMLGRYEENAYMMRMMKVVKHPNTYLYEIQGFNHGGMVHPAFSILLDHVFEIIKNKNN